MSAALVRWSATLGFQLVSSLARLLGSRVVSALFVSATGRVLLRVLVSTIGGPFALIPQTVLATALNSVVPSPVVLLRGVRAGVRVVYVLLETPLAQGARRVLVRLNNSSFTAPVPEQRAQWLAPAPTPIDEYEPRARVLHVPSAAATPPAARVHEVEERERAADAAAPDQGARAAEALAQSAPIVLELSEDALNEVEAHFDGDRADLDASAFPDFLREHGRNDEAALSASRIVTEGALDDSWRPAELLLQSRHGAHGEGELSATLGVPVPDAAPEMAMNEEDAADGWVALGDLCAPSSSS